MRARARAAAEHRRRRHLRAQRGHGSGRRQRVRRDQGRPAHLGGPLPARDHRATTAEPLPDGERGELVFTSLTKEAFPVMRYRTRDLTRLLPGTARPGDAPHREDHRPQRRHDHPARRQPLPHADRGDRARHRDAHPALHPRTDPRRASWMLSRCASSGIPTCRARRAKRPRRCWRSASRFTSARRSQCSSRSPGRPAAQRGQVQAGLRPALTPMERRARRARIPLLGVRGAPVRRRARITPRRTDRAPRTRAPLTVRRRS